VIGPLRALYELKLRSRPLPLDDGYFGPNSPAWDIHAAPSSFIGGMRALLMHALHPLVMAGAHQHGKYASDPWTRLTRTLEYLLATVFGDRATAEQAAERVCQAHAPVYGVEPVTGRAYSANHQDLLRYVHATGVDSYLTAYETYVRRLAPADADRYVAERAGPVAFVGLVDDVPKSVESLRAYLSAMESELLVTPPSFGVCELVTRSPLPPPLNLVAGIPGAAAVVTLPPRYRDLFRVNWTDRRDRRVRKLGRVYCRIAALGGEPPYARAARRAARKRARTRLVGVTTS
jgi:uncharacterized protein (DUF2236 family)